ncbi:MAG TPA: lamin tail domain-containing protein, partial [Tepidisphaeraceae bacterium]|nr:lamin tail domain-containing protein [Tepidisphaeraceae bacterium]
MKRNKMRGHGKLDPSLRARRQGDDRQECLSHRGLERLESRLMLAADVVINEIMYHPFSPSNPSAADQAEEYIELYNKGNASANLTGWHFDRGISYTFSGGTLAAGGYLVVAADLGKFGAKYPGVSNVVGGWTGRLSNSGEEIRLVDNVGGTVDSVTYADEGDWAAREHSRGVSLVENLTRDLRISGITRNGSVATVTTVAAHGLTNGASVTIRGANEAEYNGTFVVGGVSSTTFTYTVSGTPNTPASGVMFTNIPTNTATAVITGHGYSVGDQIQIFGANQTQYNQTISVSASTLNTISYPVSGSPADIASGTIYARQITDHNHSGWSWVSYADGLGKSLELVNQSLTNNEGQNWKESNALQGTPGAVNSVNSGNIAPMILDLTNFPVVPTSSDSVRISARIVDEGTPSNVTLFYRNDGAGSFDSLAMHDDGVNGDLVAGDGTWSGLLLPQPDKTIVEFYVSASDGSITRTAPGPTDGSGTQGANALYQVDNTVYGGTQPLYRFIMTATE